MGTPNRALERTRRPAAFPARPVGAIAVACLLAFSFVTDGPDRAASGGMYSLADALVFLATLSASSVPSALVVLYYLRKHSEPWPILAALGLAASFSGWVAAAAVSGLLSENGAWSLLAVPRILVAPLLLCLFGMLAAFSPSRASRAGLAAAAGVECVTAGYGFVHWFVPALHP